MIALEAVSARQGPLALASVSVTWGRGIHAIVGGHGDGGRLVLALIAGASRPRTGRVRVLDGPPTDHAVRRHIAFVPLEPSLPEALRVREVLAMASAIRGEPFHDPVERLGALGVEALVSRGVWTLSRAEARAVAIAEAATSTRVRVLLIEEPWVALDPRAASPLPELLRARSRDGHAVIFATASVRDAADLADDCILLSGGTIVGRPSSTDRLVGFSPGGVRIRIIASDPLALAGSLAREAGIEAVARRNTVVTVRGRDAVELSRAVSRAILASAVDVTEVRVEPPSLEEARAAAAGLATATYENAVARTRASLEPALQQAGAGKGAPTINQEPP
ncbi:MAG: ATP-binding cassette domain-containing protein [Myxococcota bacterium]|nr:ATP-binding cassette domain-containing protein [Myxococcota bacterium]